MSAFFSQYNYISYFFYRVGFVIAIFSFESFFNSFAWSCLCTIIYQFRIIVVSCQCIFQFFDFLFAFWKFSNQFIDVAKQ